MLAVVLSGLLSSCSESWQPDESLVTACGALRSADWVAVENSETGLEEAGYEDIGGSMGYTAYQALRTDTVGKRDWELFGRINLEEALRSAWDGCTDEVDDFPAADSPDYRLVMKDLEEREQERQDREERFAELFGK